MIKYLVVYLVIVSKIPNNEGRSTSPINSKRFLPPNEANRAQDDVTEDKRTSQSHASEVTKSLKEIVIEKLRLNTENGEVTANTTESTRAGTLLPTFPYPLGSVEPEIKNKTAELIQIINKIDVKQIIPLVVNSGGLKPMVSGLKSGKSHLEDRRESRNRIWQRHTPDHNESLVFLLQPHLDLTEGKDVRTHLISNPEVIQNYISRRRRKKKQQSTSSSSEDYDLAFRNEQHRRFDFRRRKEKKEKDAKKYQKTFADHKSRRRRHKRKKKKSRSTSSSSESNDDSEDFRTRNRRMEYPPYRAITSASEEIEKRANTGEVEKLNYDDRSDDYVITTKKGIWDYEHENWAVVTKKLNWDDVQSSTEFNQSSEHSIDDKRTLKKKHVQIYDENHKDILEEIDEEHKKFNIKHDKLHSNSILVAEDEDKLEKQDVGSDRKRIKSKKHSKTTPEISREKTRNLNHDVKKKYYSGEYKNDSWSRKKKKIESKENKDSERHKRKERYSSSRRTTRQMNRWDRNKTKQWSDDDNKENRERFKPIRNNKEEFENENNRDYDRSDKTTKDKTGRLVDDWVKDKNKRHKHDDYEDYNRPKKVSQLFKDSRSAENKKENRYNVDYISVEQYNVRDNREKILKRDSFKSDSHEETFLAGDNRPDNKYEEDKHSEENKRYYKKDTVESKNRIKKSHLREAKIEKKWGTAKKVDWSREDLRSNKKNWHYKDKDVSRNNEHYRYPNAKGHGHKLEEKKKKHSVPFEDFWNRHAHNQWDKVGADRGSKNSQKVPNVRIPIRNTERKDFWDRHGNNDWDRVGRNDEYKERISYDNKPQSHRSQNSGLPIYFGYVHTPLPFRGKKTVFDDK